MNCVLKPCLRDHTEKCAPVWYLLFLGVPTLHKVVWSATFVSEAQYNSARFQIFNALDHFNREALESVITTFLTSQGRVRTFNQPRT